MDDVYAVVVGAGAVGLAVARALACSHHDVLVIEKERNIGLGASSRNSEVIHAGIYSDVGSLKSKLCIEGKRLIYAYSEEKGFQTKRVGKLILATSASELPSLHAIQRKAEANDVVGLELLTAKQANEIEPEVSCVAALWSPTSGIVDSDGFLRALRSDLENAGGWIAFNSPLLSAIPVSKGVVVEVGGSEPTKLLCKLLINSAGLNAESVSRTIAGFPPQKIPRTYFAKGTYFNLVGGKPPFQHLVYPLPEQGGLGVHATIDLAGSVRFGPDVEWISEISYFPSAARKSHFEREIRRYWPALPDGSLFPSYCGIRPKLSPPGAPAADFMIETELEHGIAGVVNLFGIESPGLTSAMAIAEEVVRRLRQVEP